MSPIPRKPRVALVALLAITMLLSTGSAGSAFPPGGAKPPAKKPAKSSTSRTGWLKAKFKKMFRRGSKNKPAKPQRQRSLKSFVAGIGRQGESRDAAGRRPSAPRTSKQGRTTRRSSESVSVSSDTAARVTDTSGETPRSGVSSDIAGRRATVANGNGHVQRHRNSIQAARQRANSAPGAAGRGGGSPSPPRGTEGLQRSVSNKQLLPRDVNRVRNTFTGGGVERRVASSDMTAYRVHGGTAGPRGRFLTDTKPTDATSARNTLALATQWGNSATQATTVTIPKGTVYYVGSAGAQTSYAGGPAGARSTLPGGGRQLFVRGDALGKLKFGATTSLPSN